MRRAGFLPALGLFVELGDFLDLTHEDPVNTRAFAIHEGNDRSFVLVDRRHQLPEVWRRLPIGRRDDRVRERNDPQESAVGTREGGDGAGPRVERADAFDERVDRVVEQMDRRSVVGETRPNRPKDTVELRREVAPRASGRIRV
jgi:hypothetical protein